MKKSSLKCTWIYAADFIFRTKRYWQGYGCLSKRPIQRMQTQIKLSDQGLACLLFWQAFYELQPWKPIIFLENRKREVFKHFEHLQLWALQEIFLWRNIWAITQNTIKKIILCAQQLLISNWAFAQFDQSSFCVHEWPRADWKIWSNLYYASLAGCTLNFHPHAFKKKSHKHYYHSDSVWPLCYLVWANPTKFV